MPSASGLSGPTTVRSACFSWANASSFGRSSAPMFTHSTGVWFFAGAPGRCRRYPARTTVCVTCGDCASFQTSACSRPPEPMTNSFIGPDSIRKTAAEEKKYFVRAAADPGGHGCLNFQAGCSVWEYGVFRCSVDAVAQICNSAVSRICNPPGVASSETSSVAIPAECNSAIQQITNLRYGALRSTFRRNPVERCADKPEN